MIDIKRVEAGEEGRGLSQLLALLIGQCNANETAIAKLTDRVESIDGGQREWNARATERIEVLEKTREHFPHDRAEKHRDKLAELIWALQVKNHKLTERLNDIDDTQADNFIGSPIEKKIRKAMVDKCPDLKGRPFWDEVAEPDAQELKPCDVDKFRRAVQCLALELPGGVFADFAPLAYAVAREAENSRKTRPIEDELRAESELLKAKRDFTYCAYCGEEFPADDDAATQVSDHIKTCPQHPMRDVEADLAEANAKIKRVRKITQGNWNIDPAAILAILDEVKDE